MEERVVERWVLAKGCVSELEVIRQELKRNPAATDGKRRGIVLAQTVALDDDDIVGDVLIISQPADALM